MNKKVPKRVKFYMFFSKIICTPILRCSKYCVNYVLEKSLVASGSQKIRFWSVIIKKINIFCTSVRSHHRAKSQITCKPCINFLNKMMCGLLVARTSWQTQSHSSFFKQFFIITNYFLLCCQILGDQVSRLRVWRRPLGGHSLQE